MTPIFVTPIFVAPILLAPIFVAPFFMAPFLLTLILLIYVTTFGPCSCTRFQKSTACGRPSMPEFTAEHEATLRRLKHRLYFKVHCGIDDRCEDHDAIAAALAEIERLRKEACKFYQPDGSYVLLASPEAVVERRKEFAHEIERLRQWRERAIERWPEGDDDRNAKRVLANTQFGIAMLGGNHRTKADAVDAIVGG